VRRRLAGAAANSLTAALARSAGAPLLERMLYMELHGFLPDHNLNYTDKASMAHGVEVRVPLLDTRLIAFASALPPSLKVRFGAEKWLFKRAVAERLPRRVLMRKKTGFGAPVRRWLRGPMRGMVEDILGSQSFRERGLFDNLGVRRLLDDTRAGRRDGAYLILALVMMELWLRQFAARVDA
jgi:asparagine synthase (glutamine-hydrolysing)